MKLKSKKSALLLSFTSLLICFAMLAGSTFAWFTDTATTGVNKIVAGNLDVELEYKNSDTTSFTKADENTKVFKEGALWEPGHVEYVVLKVSNAGNLALKYKLGINIAGETGSTNVYDNPFNLSDYIRFAVLDGDKTEDSVDRDALVAAATDSKLIKEGYSKEDHLLAGETDSKKVVTLVVWMPTTVGNEANHKTGVTAPSIDLGISVVATQYTHENDSFNDQYDKDAAYPEVNAADLAATLETLADNAVITVNGTVSEALTISKPVTIHNLTATAPVTIASSGVTLNAAKIEYKAAKTPALVVNSGVTDVTITNSVITAKTGNGGSHTAVSLPVSGKVVFTGNTVTNDYNGIEFGLNVPTGDGTLIANNNFINIGNNAISIYQVEDNATVTVKNNTFTGKAGDFIPVRLSNSNNMSGKFVFANNIVDTDNAWKQCFVMLEDYSQPGAGIQDFTKYTLIFNDNTVGTSCTYTVVFDDQDGVITTNQPVVQK